MADGPNPRGKGAPEEGSGGLYGIARASVAIGKLRDLSSTQSAVLQAIARTADWRSFECEATVERLEAQTGFKRRTVQIALRKLERRQLISVVRLSKGRRATRYRLEIERIERMGTPTVTNPTTLNGAACAPFIRAPVAPIHNHRNQELNEKNTNRNCAERDTVRSVLRRNGIKGVNLERLTQSDVITVDLIGKELKHLSRAPDIRDPAAVLADRLLKKAGLRALHEGAARAKPSSPEIKSAATQLEKMRRNSKWRSPDATAD